MTIQFSANPKTSRVSTKVNTRVTCLPPEPQTSNLLGWHGQVSDDKKQVVLQTSHWRSSSGKSSKASLSAFTVPWKMANIWTLLLKSIANIKWWWIFCLWAKNSWLLKPQWRTRLLFAAVQLSIQLKQILYKWNACAILLITSVHTICRLFKYQSLLHERRNIMSSKSASHIKRPHTQKRS